MKKQIRMNESTDEKAKVYSYQLHNWRYLNAKLPILHKDFSESPELKEMKLKFRQVEREKRRRKSPRRVVHSGLAHPEEEEGSRKRQGAFGGAGHGRSPQSCERHPRVDLVRGAEGLLLRLREL